jgi:PKD repeat protein
LVVLALGLALLLPRMAAAAPTASFTFSPSNPAPGDTVTFTSTSSADVVSEQWDIAGQSASGPTATAQFLNPGSYRVTLTVSDFFGDTASRTRTVTVGVQADFSASPSSPLVGETVTFKSRTSGNVSSESWDLDGDGNADATGSSAQWTYTAPGRYKATLQVTDASGHTTSASKTIDVVSANQPPNASFSVSPSSPSVGQPVELRSKSTDRNGDIVQESWDLNGDGQYGDATGPTATTSFPAPGSYTIGLQVTDATGNVVATTKTVKVDGAAGAGFSFSPATPVTGEKVTFTAADTTARKLKWDLDGDGHVGDAKGPVVTWTYKKAGTVTVELEAEDASGSKSTSFQTVQVYAPGTVPVPPAPPPPPPPPPGGTSTAKSDKPAGGSGAQQKPAHTASLLTPFPVIRIRGRIFRYSAWVDILSVSAQQGATVQVRCRGRGCPRHVVTVHVRSSRHAQRIHAFERLLRAGTVLEIRVTKAGRIGKYTRFVIRGGAAPARRDLCVGPAAARPIRCPTQ